MLCLTLIALIYTQFSKSINIELKQKQ